MYGTQRKIEPFPAVASGAIVVGLVAALIMGLQVREVVSQAEALVAVAFSLDQPPEPEPEKPRLPSEQSAPKGDPAPRNLRNRATQIVAPEPPFVLKEPPPIVTAPVANTGDAADNGASDLPGPGQGAGGEGDGFGGGGLGGEGNGRGSGGGPPVIAPRKIRGSLGYRDIPAELLPEGHGPIAVEVLFAVEADGRVDDCQAVRSSGEPRIDARVCSLIEQRFVFRPARDRKGKPVRSRVIEEHSWFGRPQGG